MQVKKGLGSFALALMALCGKAQAEDGSAGWLRYAPLSSPSQYRQVPSRIEVLGSTRVERAAAQELQRALTSLLGRNFTVASPSASLQKISGSAIVLGTTSKWTKVSGIAKSTPALQGEQYRIIMQHQSGNTHLLLLGGTPQAELYAVFHLLEEIASQKPIPADEDQAPSALIRWTDEWDNLSGTVERGYAGPSIFFENGHVKQDLTRASQYARLLASVGINGCNVNNVNADLDLLTTDHLKEFARLADAFRPWGVKLALSIDLSSPQTVGGLATFDPLDAGVIAWWQKKVDEVYTLIPDFGGFTVKADSEGRAGPSQYGRTPADAANVLAHALKPHGGIVLYRGFVYNHHLNWQDRRADRARAGYDNFASLDGKFEPNVVVQVKHGPIDFQAREPVSPLIAALQHTNQALELQTTQEYTGQQRHMVWLPSMWKWVLETDMRSHGNATPVKQIVTGKSFDRPLGGFVSVVNVGMETNWLHHPMAMANLYGYGKLAWNPDESLSKIIDAWTRMTWGNDAEVVRAITSMQLASWHNYESYTGTNGMGTLTDILGVHFGPGIESAEHNGWGQWFRGEKDGIGMDRTVATGTGYVGQYPPQLAEEYKSLANCPDDLLLFFHHVAYNYRLHSGKTLIQSVYDDHYAGALAAANYVAQWQALQRKIDPERYKQVLGLFTFQAGHSLVWRDAVNDWFYRISGIADTQGRVGNDPGRIEAESMTAAGYRSVPVTPWETASGGKAVACYTASGCSLRTTVHKPSGTYDVAVQYFDLRTGISTYSLRVNGSQIATWKADDTLPPAVVRPLLDGQTSTRYTAHGVVLNPGDTLEVFGLPDMQVHPGKSEDPAGQAPQKDQLHDSRELAPVDYLVIGADGTITPQ